MNILYDYPIFQLQPYGGISRYFYELITTLSENENVNINLFEGFSVNEYGLSKHKSKFHLYKGYKSPHVRYTGSVLDNLNNIWFKKTYANISDLKIYHPTYYRGDLHKFKKSQIVLTVYDMIHELYRNEFSNNDLAIKYKRISIESSDFLICISENTKKDLINIYDVPKEKVKVVYLANSLKPSKYMKFIDIQAKYQISNPYILYVGTREGCKNFSFLLTVYAKKFSKTFDLVCFGGHKFNQKELNTLTNYGLSNKVIQINGSDELLASLYKNAFCFVYPSLYEGFGLPPLEAMALGCPVVASNSSSIPEVVGNGGILFDSYSEESMINAIESISCSESTRNKLVKRGFEQENKFSWEKTAKETFDIYKNLI